MKTGAGRFHRISDTTVYTINTDGEGIICSTAHDLDRVVDKVAQEHIGFPIDYGDWETMTKAEIAKAGVVHNHKAMKLAFSVTEDALDAWRADGGK